MVDFTSGFNVGAQEEKYAAHQDKADMPSTETLIENALYRYAINPDYDFGPEEWDYRRICAQNDIPYKDGAFKALFIKTYSQKAGAVGDLSILSPLGHNELMDENGRFLDSYYPNLIRDAGIAAGVYSHSKARVLAFIS